MTRGRWSADHRAALIPVLCAVFAYGVVCLGAFVYDDHHSVADNAALWDLSNLPRFFVDATMFSALENNMYRPVLLCSFALNHLVSGHAAWAFKLTNLLIHAGCAVMLFALARRLGVARTAAVVGASLFAVHPLASEAVNMISGRSEMLMVAGLLVAVHGHLAAERGVRGAWIVTVLGTVVACGSKETGVIAPVLVLGVSWLHRAPVRLARRALHVLPVVAVVVVYLWARREILGVATLDAPSWSSGRDPRMGAGRDLLTQLCTMATLLPRTLGQFVVPTDISLDPVIAYTDDFLRVDVVAGALLLLGLTVVGLWRPRSRVAVAFGTAFTWGTSLPWILIPLNVPLSEHRLYGLLAGLGLVSAAVLQRVRWEAPAAEWRARYARVLVAVVLAAFAVGSTARSWLYRDEVELWRVTHASNPDSYRACYGLGVCLMKVGELEPARLWMERALERYPDYVSAQRNVVEINLQLGDEGDPVRALELAESLCERTATNPFYLLLHSRALLAVARRTGDAATFDRSVEVALRTLDVAPPKALVYRTAAMARREQGEHEQALALLDQSVARGLDHVSVWIDRHDVLMALGRRDEAQESLREAMQRSPFDGEVRARMQARPPN